MFPLLWTVPSSTEVHGETCKSLLLAHIQRHQGGNMRRLRKARASAGWSFLFLAYSTSWFPFLTGAEGNCETTQFSLFHWVTESTVLQEVDCRTLASQQPTPRQPTALLRYFLVPPSTELRLAQIASRKQDKVVRAGFSF